MIGADVRPGDPVGAAPGRFGTGQVDPAGTQVVAHKGGPVGGGVVVGGPLGPALEPLPNGLFALVPEGIHFRDLLGLQDRVLGENGEKLLHLESIPGDVVAGHGVADAFSGQKFFDSH